jgi:hypothetical protein
VSIQRLNELVSLHKICYMCGHHSSIAVNVYETAAAPPGLSESLPDHAVSSVACELKSAACKMSGYM